MSMALCVAGWAERSCRHPCLQPQRASPLRLAAKMGVTVGDALPCTQVMSPFRLLHCP